MKFAYFKDAFEAATIYVSNKLTFVGGGTAAVFGFLHQNMVAIGGFALGVLGFLTNLYFQKRRDRREEMLTQRQMEKLRTQPSPLERTSDGL